MVGNRSEPVSNVLEPPDIPIPNSMLISLIQVPQHGELIRYGVLDCPLSTRRLKKTREVMCKVFGNRTDSEAVAGAVGVAEPSYFLESLEKGRQIGLTAIDHCRAVVLSVSDGVLRGHNWNSV
jgi:hypothetical protein